MREPSLTEMIYLSLTTIKMEKHTNQKPEFFEYPWLSDDTAKMIVLIEKGYTSAGILMFKMGKSESFISSRTHALVCGGILQRSKAYKKREVYYSVSDQKWIDLAIAWLNRYAQERVKAEVKEGESVGVESN